jgi:hypothetical protein
MIWKWRCCDLGVEYGIAWPAYRDLAEDKNSWLLTETQIVRRALIRPNEGFIGPFAVALDNELLKDFFTYLGSGID